MPPDLHAGHRAADRAGPSPLSVPDLGTILSMWAHPDDETYLSGGVMAAAVERGQRVVCVAASAGELGTDDPVAWPPERLARVRRLEAAASMAVLGVSEHHVLGLPDGGLPDHEQQGRSEVELLLDEVRPDTVITFGADGITFHPDHVAVHRWVTGAWEARHRTFRLLYATMSTTHVARFGAVYEAEGVYMSDQRQTGVAPERLALQLCLDGPALDRKLTALRAMATQTAPLIAALGHDTFAAEAAEESFVDAGQSAPRP